MNLEDKGMASKFGQNQLIMKECHDGNPLLLGAFSYMVVLISTAHTVKELKNPSLRLLLRAIGVTGAHGLCIHYQRLVVLCVMD